MGVAVLQMTSNVTQRYAVSPLLPGANVTIELVRPRLCRVQKTFLCYKGRESSKKSGNSAVQKSLKKFEIHMVSG